MAAETANNKLIFLHFILVCVLDCQEGENQSTLFYPSGVSALLYLYALCNFYYVDTFYECFRGALLLVCI
jgi:hypothetical protein